jgi:hypothetical protein
VVIEDEPMRERFSVSTFSRRTWPSLGRGGSAAGILALPR